MRRFCGALLHYRPRVLTLVVLVAVAAVLVLANLSDEVARRRAPTSPAETLAELRAQLRFDAREPPRRDWPGSAMWNVSYGWPLLWHQYVAMQAGYGMAIVGECRGTGRRAGNVAMWFVMLAAPAATCEWLLRRYRPRLRWSLRTMLVAIGLVAAGCGWFVAARNRSDVQDPLIAEIERRNDRVWVKRWGPDWLDVVGADRLRRQIIGAEPRQGLGDEEIEALLARLAPLPKLRYLFADVGSWTPGIAAALDDMRHLRTLSLDISDPTPGLADALGKLLADKRDLRALEITFFFWTEDGDQEAISEDFLTSISKLTQLESLSVQSSTTVGECLARLKGLTNLKSLTLVLGDQSRPPSSISSLTVLPRLERLELRGLNVGDGDLRCLADLPRLKSLDLTGTAVTGAGLADFASLKSLEELFIDGEMLSGLGPDSLSALERLRALHIVGFQGVASPEKAIGRDQLQYMSAGETVGCLNTLEALRKSKPELVIDGDCYSQIWPGPGLKPSESDAANPSRLIGSRRALDQWKQEQAKKASGSK